MMYGKSRFSRQKQERLIEHFVSGATARCKADLAGVNKNTAVYYFHRLREIIACQIEQELHEVFGGEVNVSYCGCYRKDNRGRDAGGRVAVFGL